MKVALIGRPNVGKSTLFNRLIGRRLAVEDESPGTTRDRVVGTLDLESGSVELVDTAGLIQKPSDELEEATRSQLEYATENADLLLFLVDLERGISPADQDMALRIRKKDVPTVLVANKQDASGAEDNRYDLHSLGFEHPVTVSALRRTGLDELRKRIQTALPDQPVPSPERPDRKIALVGRQNVGKSTFLNALAGDERAIVTDQAGTTRDLVDLHLTVDGTDIVLVDTPGIVRSGHEDSTADIWSQKRSRRAIRRADAILHMMEAPRKTTRVDKRLASFIEEEKKPHVLVINKWDLAPEDVGPEDFSEYLYKTMPGTRRNPLALCSARQNVNVRETVLLGAQLIDRSRREVSDDELTSLLEKVIGENPPPAQEEGPFPAFNRATQVDTAPPHFVLTVNDPSQFPDEYRTFLKRKIREEAGFLEVPVRLQLQPR